MFILNNRRVNDTEHEYVTFADGVDVRTFIARPAVAARYARRYGIALASPMDYWRLVVR